MTLEQLQRALRGGRLEHSIAVLAEHRADELSHVRRVFDDEDGLAVPFRRVDGERRSNVRRDAVTHDREEHVDLRADVFLAREDDVTARLFDDPVHRREPEPGAFVPLRREERLERAGGHLGRHPRAGVGHAQPQVAIRLHIDVLGRVARIDVRLGGLDRDHASTRHRIASVHRQVQDDLLELREADAHEPELVAELEPELDVLAERLPYETVERDDDGVELEEHRLDDVAPTDEQELARETDRAEGGAVELAHLLALAFVGELALQDRGVVQDDGEQVVEVVRHTSGQAGDVLEAPGLDQLHLEGAATFLSALALEGAHHDFAGDPEERDIGLGPYLGDVHGVEPEEAHHLPGIDHREREDRLHALLDQRLLLCGSLRREQLDVGEMDGLASAEQPFGPPREHVERQVLHHLEQRVDARCTPLVSVVHRGAVGGETEDVRAIDACELADGAERLLDPVVDGLRGQAHELARQARD